MGRDNSGEFKGEKGDNFNSHARVGRDAFTVHHIVPLEISTHTPAWGATGYKIRC